MFDFIMTNLNDLLIAVTSIVTGASAICVLTPNKKDDSIMAKIQKTVNILALNFGHAKTA